MSSQSGNNVYYLQISTFLRPLAIIAVLLGVSVYVNSSQWAHLSLWEYCAFGALPIMLATLFLLRMRMFLKFDNESLTVHYVIGSERRYKFRDITKVWVVSFKRPMQTVVLRLRADAPGLTAQNNLYRAVTGYDVSIPPFFGPPMSWRPGSKRNGCVALRR